MFETGSRRMYRLPGYKTGLNFPFSYLFVCRCVSVTPHVRLLSNEISLQRGIDANTKFVIYISTL